jgi:hypothetical protein
MTKEMLLKVKELQACIGALKPSDQEFASSLCQKFFQYGKLTPGQEPWVQKMIDRAKEPKVSKLTVSVGGFEGVVALFKKAKEHLKYPKIVLLCASPESPTQKIYLSMAGPTSKNAGKIQIQGEGVFPNRPYFGSVDQAGNWTPGKASAEGLEALLIEFGKNPAKVAKEYGSLTGSCCFCGSPLTDPKSTAAGFGPVCAAHYGLTQQYNAALNLYEESLGSLHGNAVANKTKFYTPPPAVENTIKFLEPLSSAEMQLLQDVAEENLGNLPIVEKNALCYLCEENASTKIRDGYCICEECDAQLSSEAVIG